MQERPIKTINLTRSEKRKLSLETLPEIPDKRYFTIGEVSSLCGVKPHVLRYWEQEFSALHPMKRRGNRRYYQHEDVLMIRQICKLLYEEGFTIEGAKTHLTHAPTTEVINLLPTPTSTSNTFISKIIQDLEEVLHQLQSE
jgi:DNA-binding transcriptional MerR regulator